MTLVLPESAARGACPPAFAAARRAAYEDGLPLLPRLAGLGIHMARELPGIAGVVGALLHIDDDQWVVGLSTDLDAGSRERVLAALFAQRLGITAERPLVVLRSDAGVWADFNGTLLELKTTADIQHVQERVHTFLQQLAALSGQLTNRQEKNRPGDNQPGGGGAGFLGPAYGLGVPGGGAGAIKAQLFQSEDDSQLPVAAFWSEECLTADITADQSRAFAMELRRMANDVDLLAARLDEITALRGADGVVEVPSEAA